MKLITRFFRGLFESRLRSLITLAPGLILLGYSWMSYRLPGERAELQKAEELIQTSEGAVRSTMEILLPSLLAIHRNPSLLTPGYWDQLNARTAVQLQGREEAISNFLKKHHEPLVKADANKGPLTHEISKFENLFAKRISQTLKQRKDFGSGIRRTTQYDEAILTSKVHQNSGRGMLHKLNAKLAAIENGDIALARWASEKRRDFERVESWAEALLLLGTSLSLLVAALQQIHLGKQQRAPLA